MSLFKRLFRDREDVSSQPGVFKGANANITTLGSSLQKRFSRGVQYNMKILIRGDRNVGKSALLNRLRGHEYVDRYIPTEEIEVACIHWSYRGNEDVVKVEVWDVVDKGRKRAATGPLKMDNTEEASAGPMCLDAEFLDVYKGAHGLIIMLDMTKSWTFGYVERELGKVPEDLPVLVLANHRDMGHHRTVTADQVAAVLEALPGHKKGLVKYWESSMKNGYGLVYIHKFFSVPFLLLQRDTLLRQLATNEEEVKGALEGLQEVEEAADSTYDSFVRSLKGNSVATKPASLGLHLSSNPSSQVTSPTETCRGAVTPLADSGVARAPIHPPQAHAIPGMDKLGLFPLPVPTSVTVPGAAAPRPAPTAPPAPARSNHADKREIFDFVPEEQPELSSFLDDPLSPRSHVVVGNSVSSSSAEDEGPAHASKHNPMVASFQDDIDLEDDHHLPLGDAPPARLPLSPSSSSSDDDRRHPPPAPHLHHKVAANGDKPGVRTGADEKEDGHEHEVKVSEISFDLAELEILENRGRTAPQGAASPDRDTDDLTVTSGSSAKAGAAKKHSTKKHHHHHHKQHRPEVPVEPLGSKKRSSKHKKSSRRSVEESLRPGDGVVAQAAVVAVPTNGDSSDSLEKFLNE